MGRATSTHLACREKRQPTQKLNRIHPTKQNTVRPTGTAYPQRTQSLEPLRARAPLTLCLTLSLLHEADIGVQNLCILEFLEFLVHTHLRQ